MTMADSPDTKQTDFGYQRVTHEEKVKRVNQVFTSVAHKYDLMNDLMSFGIHRIWKSITVTKASVRPGDKILDIASGSGDLALALAKKVMPAGQVVLADINNDMLERGRIKLVDNGYGASTQCVVCDAQNLAFKENYFDRVTIAFGLRNVLIKEKALQQMYLSLKPGGKALILEFSHPVNKTVSTFYDQYSLNVIPKLGELITNDSESYQYLVESIRKHPDQDTLKSMMSQAGFDHVEYHNFSAGIVALHIGYKY